jgi:hypothetical protein
MCQISSLAFDPRLPDMEFEGSIISLQHRSIERYGKMAKNMQKSSRFYSTQASHQANF